MTSYRFKLLNGRVLGPFDLDHIPELVEKNILKGNEYVQVFPDGDWVEVSENNEINSVITSYLLDGKKLKNNSNQDPLDKTTSLTLDSSLEKELKEKNDNQYREFKFSINKEDDFNYDELEEKYRDKKDSNENTEKETEGGLEKTRVVRLHEIDNIDKTIVVNMAEVEKPKKANTETKTIEEKEVVKNVPVPISTTDKTEFIDLSKIKNELIKSEELKDHEETRVLTRKDLSKHIQEEEEVKKRKLSPILVAVFIGIFYLLLFEEEEKETQKLIAVDISTPVAKEVADPALAHKLYEEGMSFYKKNTYKDKVLAASRFKSSLESSYQKNPSLSMLIRVYSELLDNASDRKRAKLAIFRLIRLSRAKVLKDVNIAYGTALFYRKLNKEEASLRTIENFLRIGKPSLDILCLYGEVLLDLGNYIKAKNVIDKLADVKNKPAKAYLVMSRYYLLDQQKEKAREIIMDGGRNFPNNNHMMVRFAEIELDLQNFKSFEKILRALTMTKGGGEPIVYAKYLELMGLLSSLKGNSKQAAMFLKSSLGMNDSAALRSRIGMLNVEGDRLSQALIKESKSLNYVKTSRKHVVKKEWEEAFKFALEAVDINPGFLPVELNLVDLQVKRGYLETAILKLESLKKSYPLSPHVLYRLVKAYLSARKFEKAKYEINYISTSKFEKDDKYNALLGYYYSKIERFGLAIKFYNRAIRINPLKDDVYFEMAKIFMSGRKYTEAKKALTEAIYFDPNNLEYRSLHSKIIFELDGAETAVGYLQDLLTENRDDPLIYGNIAIYYYKSGQIKQFEFYREKLSKLRKKDENFYRFMIESAELEGRYEDIIVYSRELLKINPGNIEVRMKLGNYLSISERFFEALNAYRSVLDRLPGYPLANYYIGKIQLIQRKYKDALESGEKEMKYNPTLYNGYYIVGEANRKLEEYALAIKSLEKAISLAPRSVESLMSLGWIKYKQNFLEISRELYNRAKNVEPNNPEIRRELGNVYVGIGQSTLAIEEFEIYLKLAPSAKDRVQITNKIKNLSR